MNTSLRTYWLGRRDYAPTLQLMQDLVTARRKNQIQDMLLLLEHAPVITLGRGAKLQHILEGKEELERIGIQVVETGRGG
ncbi:MAG: octanoyltransferase, partial [Polyangiaceae bacterium]|nr:octanoyltransferase [Polyangiaceae bacterium]